MSVGQAVEAFPAVSTSHQFVQGKNSKPTDTHRRRTSSGLGGEPRGDTAAPAFATLPERSLTTSKGASSSS
ncbi:hypothetical protein LTS18_000443, partial [Coniosporium uncinatum]